MAKLNSEKGFTLVEVLIVSSIFAILMAGFMSSSTAMLRSYRFSSDKLLEMRENRKALETTFNELRLASSGSISIKLGNQSISYSSYDQSGNTANCNVYLDNDHYIYSQQISNGVTTLKKLYPQTVHNFNVTKDSNGNINIIICYTANTSMSVSVKPLNP